MDKQNSLVKIEEKIGPKIDRLFAIREEKEKLNKQIKELNKAYEEYERKIIQLLEAQGLDKARGDKATVSIAPALYPTVIDKVLMVRWAVENDRFDILQSRVSAGPIKEMFMEQNKLVPGVDLYTKTKLSLTRKRGA